MKTDIWAVGCVLFELICGQKAFTSDYQLCDCLTRNMLPEIPSMPDDDDGRVGASVKQILSRTLEVDWWKRPTAEDVLTVLHSTFEETTEVYLLDGEHGAFVQRVRLYPDSPSWRSVRWDRHWYKSPWY